MTSIVSSFIPRRARLPQSRCDRAQTWAALEGRTAEASALEYLGGYFHVVSNTPGGFHSFENRWSLASAFEFQTQVGRAAIEERIHGLNTRLKQGLRGLRKVKLYTPVDPALSCGINCFEVEGQKPDAVVNALMEKRIIASSSPYRVSYARLSASLLNDEEQVDAALAAVAKL